MAAFPDVFDSSSINLVAAGETNAVRAAAEIQKYIEKMSGAKLPIVEEGQPVEGNDSLVRVMNHKHGGDPLTLTVYRGGHREKVQIHLGEAPQQL